ncbi:trypsin [Corynebacterium sp. CCM 8862]|uniref:Trypsin n=2 Tax=Corynebacterium mendelii TaxID=2765362 RepID=A0A939IX35_9CORY|nr:trypsin [Corynebacterium mendelii]
MPIRPRLEGPNHHWKSDPLSMIMALHPGPVLHRVAGSWFHAPDVPREAYVAEAREMALVGPGTPLYLGENNLCTLGVAGYDAEGTMVGITAGHCGAPGDEVLSADSWPIGTIGYVVRHSGRQDYALIRFESDKTQLTRSYNGVTVDSLGWDRSVNKLLCKHGVATGRTCGLQFMADDETSLSQVCSMQGDSGAPMLDGTRLTGIVSGGLIPKGQMSCRTPLQGVFFSPVTTHSIDAIIKDLDSRGGYGAGFHLPAPDGSDPLAAGNN